MFRSKNDESLIFVNKIAISTLTGELQRSELLPAVLRAFFTHFWGFLPFPLPVEWTMKVRKFLG